MPYYCMCLCLLCVFINDVVCVWLPKPSVNVLLDVFPTELSHHVHFHQDLFVPFTRAELLLTRNA